MRFFITCLLGAVVYTAGGVIDPPDIALGIFLYPIIGLFFTAATIGIILVPLRLGFGEFLPQTTRRTQGFSSLGLVGLMLAIIVVSSADAALRFSRWGVFFFWLFYAAVIITFWFWPESDPRQIHVPRDYNKT